MVGAQITLSNNRTLLGCAAFVSSAAIKTQCDFDFSFLLSIKREQIDSLHELGCLERKENVVCSVCPTSTNDEGTNSGWTS